MSLNKAALVVILMASVSPVMFGQVSCPASVTGTATATAPEGWSVVPEPMDSRLQRISIYQESADGKKYDLAPDSTSRLTGVVKQIWTVPHDASLKTYLQCRYQNTGVTLMRALEPEVKACAFRFIAGRNGAVLKVLEVSCR